MKTLVVARPTLDEYLDRVKRIAASHLGDEDQWFLLSDKEIGDQDDRDEFSFIKAALWDKLMEKDFFSCSEPHRVSLNENCVFIEPGKSPGSTIWEGVFWMPISTQSSLIAF